jgi:carbon monoxide dehydrogenase subunit G
MRLTRRSAFTLALSMFLGVAVPLGAQDRSDFTEAERRILSSGRLVTHRRYEQRGQLVHFGGTSFQTVDRPIEEVWRAVRDPATYRNLLPQVESVRVVQQRERDAVLRVEHAYGIIRAAYHLRLRFVDARHDVTFDLDPSRPNDVRVARGFLTLSEWPGAEGRTLVSWGILAAVDEGLIGGLVRPQLHHWMLRVPTTMRGYLHGHGRSRFMADSGQSARATH